MQHLALIPKQNPSLLSKAKTRLEQQPEVMETPAEEFARKLLPGLLVISSNFFKCILSREDAAPKTGMKKNP